MASLLELVQETLTPDIVGKLSRLVGETPAATDSALRRAAPTVLAGVAANATTPDGVERMRSLVADGGWGADFLNSLGSRLSGGGGTSNLLASGATLVSNLFGSKSDALTDRIATGADIERSSASTILSLAAPIVMSVLGKQIASRGLDASGLSALLGSERASLLSALPAGIGALLGVKDSVGAGTRAAVAARPGLGNWWPALLAGLAALAFLFFLVNRGRQPEVASTRMDTPSAAPRQLASITLPDGTRLSVGEGGSVHRLNIYLADPAATDLPKRFVFDDLNFESGSTQLTPDGQRALSSLLAVLKAYPSVRVVLEGHTDATGDAAANKTLSQQRAEAVKQMLVDGGVAADRIGAQGYGQERPVADNDSDAGRARNRRLELVVTQR